MQEDVFLAFTEQLMQFIDALEAERAETDAALFDQREDASMRSFLATTDSFRLFLAEVVEDNRLLINDEEGITDLEDTMAAFKENGLITEDQFFKFGLLFNVAILLSEEIDKEDEIYKEAVTYLPQFCGLFAEFCQALADQEWRVEREA